MLINQIRLRGKGQSEWQAFRLGQGAGRFRSYQCLTAPAPTLRAVADGLAYALLGTESPLVGEVAVQVSDNGGHTWTVHRRAGDAAQGPALKILRDGAPLGEEGERLLAEALLDADHAEIQLTRAQIHAEGETLRARPLGAPENPLRALKDVVGRQIADIAAECARTTQVPALGEPKKLTRLARVLSPLHAQYRELCRQYAELKAEAEAGGFAEKDLATMHTLASELAILDDLAEAAGPLLEPGVSLKALKDEAAKVDAELAETCAELGIDTPAARLVPVDFRKPIEALARLEAQAKLIRASQAARKACEQTIEPLFKRYLAAAESGLAADRQVQAELESCLASLTLRLQQHDGADEAGVGNASPAAARTWFERFKARGDETARQRLSESEQAQAQAAADVETARMAIEFALARLAELGTGVEAARKKHDGAIAALDEAHEGLVQNFSRLRDHWLGVAREAALPEELDLGGLVRIAVRHGRLAALTEAREELQGRIRKYHARLAKAERLVLDWRKATGSQKSTPLDNPAFLLNEAKELLRYHEAKRKRFEQLRDAAAEAKAALALRTLLKNRRKELMTAWQTAFKELGLAPLEIHHESIGEVLRRADLVKALALIHGSATEETPAKLFATAADGTAASVYLWDEARTDNRLRLAFLSQLEEAEGGEPRLLLLADEGLTAMLAPLGIGLATRVVAATKAEAPKAEAAAAPEPQEAPRARATVKPASQGHVVKAPVSGQPPRNAAPRPNDQALLNERARRALEILAVKKP